MDALKLIQQLQLEAHPEGGYFRRSYTSPLCGGEPPRNWMSSIYYLLTADQPIGRLHSNRSDILHFWQGGEALNYIWVDAGGDLHQHILGPDLAAGQQLQLLVPGGSWKASSLGSGQWGLISEAVCPGFDYADHSMVTASMLQQQHPQHTQALAPFLKRD